MKGNRVANYNDFSPFYGYEIIHRVLLFSGQLSVYNFFMSTRFIALVIIVMMGYMPCLRSEVILDGPGNIVLSEESGDFAPDNLALAGTAFALDLINNGQFRPTHDIPNLNDGIYGNANSWIGNSLDSFCGINLGATEMTISSIAFGRDNTGTVGDRNQGIYTLQFTRMPNPDENTTDTGDANTGWNTIGMLNYGAGVAETNYEIPHLRHRYNFDPVSATGVRIIAPGNGLGSGTCIDEIELYASPGEVQEPPPPNLVLVEESGDFAPDNLAPAGIAFALDLINTGQFRPTHDIPNLNDGIYGNANSWIGNSLDSFCGINLGATEMTISSIAFGRDNTGTVGDRNQGIYTLQFTRMPNPDENTTDTGDANTGWNTIDTLNYGAPVAGTNYQSPHLRHRYNFDPVSATGVRIIVSGNGLGSGTCIDEIELYASPGEVQEPPLPMELAPTAGYEITWDGSDGDFFDSAVPDNLAQGGTAFGSSEYGAGVHLITNVNDGVYGNSNSWLANFPAGDPNPYIGVDLGGQFTIDSIAFGRDNTGTFSDRSNGLYTLQITTATDPATADDWTTIGTINYTSSLSLRHQYDINGSVIATGLRVLVSDPNICIDELEIYGQVLAVPLVVTDIVYDPNSGEVAITFNSLPGKFYALDISTSLLPGGQPGGWEEINDSVEGNAGTTTTVQDSVEPGKRFQFYRLREF